MSHPPRLDEQLNTQPPAYYRAQEPAYLPACLHHGPVQRPYQQEAIGRFVHYWEQMRRPGVPVHLLFQMATGSGKTHLMAGLMLYLYAQGYRRFLFFVNSLNIIEKTKDNFLNPASAKYLFVPRIMVGGQQVRIREVQTFEPPGQDLQLMFATVQGLHARLTAPRENSLTLADFEGGRTVLLSDEAHHISAETRSAARLSRQEQEELATWEGSIRQIFQSAPENVLIEFTATANFSLPQIAQKYHDKILFDYSLRQFRAEGYSKEVRLLQSADAPFRRALQALLLSEFRRRLFARHGLEIKPVVLFKSKTIRESHAFREEFSRELARLQPADLAELHREPEPPIADLFAFLEQQGVGLPAFLAALQEGFGPERLLSVNSMEESTEQQLALNNLEAPENPYRAIFAVDKLNEGWDVLNLFDIVRLYGGTAQTTVAEAQLIGRGARYCPFRVEEGQPLFRRKYDQQPGHPLRLCETLYYHSPHDPRYIAALHEALVRAGVSRAPGERDAVPTVQAPRPRWEALPEAITARPIALNAPAPEGWERATPQPYPLAEWGTHILYKAFSRLPFYSFAHLRSFFPDLHSAEEFACSPRFLGGLKVVLPAPPHAFSAQERLRLAVQALEELSGALRREASRLAP